MSYEQSLKNIENSINYLMPTNEDHAVFFSFEDNQPNLQLISTTNIGDLARNFRKQKIAYAMIFLCEDGFFRYYYKDPIHFYKYNYDTKKTLSDYYLGNREGLASQFFDLLKILKKTG